MKPESTLSVIYLMAICLSLPSCVILNTAPGPYIVDASRQKENQYYVKTATNVPLLTEKNDVGINGNVLAGGQASGFSLLTAYMPAKHIGIMANYSFLKNGGDMKFGQYELGAGYVEKVSKSWHFETYVGAGNGKIRNYHHTGTSQLTLTHFFIQPTIAVSNAKKTAQFAFVSRFEGVNFHNIDTTFDNAREPINTEQVTNLYKQPFHVLWQPGIVFRFGWKQFLFQTGYSYSANLTNTTINGSKGNFSAGMMVRFNAGKK